MADLKHYHIWTIGCQMNEADSGRVAAEMDALGYAPTEDAHSADVIVLNTCVVRQSAEDKAVGHLWSLKPLKEQDPDRVIALMGCMVGIKPNRALVERFPFVDVFMPPSDPGPLVGFLAGRRTEAKVEAEAETEVGARELEDEWTAVRHAFQDDASPEAAAIGLIEEMGFPLAADELPAARLPASSFQLPAPGDQFSRASAISRCKAMRPSSPTSRSSTAARTPAPSASSRSAAASSAAGRWTRSCAKCEGWWTRACAR